MFEFGISDSLNKVSKEKWVYITSKLAYVSLFCGPRVKYSFNVTGILWTLVYNNTRPLKNYTGAYVFTIQIHS